MRKGRNCAAGCPFDDGRLEPGRGRVLWLQDESKRAAQNPSEHAQIGWQSRCRQDGWLPWQRSWAWFSIWPAGAGDVTRAAFSEALFVIVLGRDLVMGSRDVASVNDPGRATLLEGKRLNCGRSKSAITYTPLRGATFRKSGAQRHDAARDDALDVNTLVKSRGKRVADKFAGPCVRSVDCWSSGGTEGSGAKGCSRIGGHGIHSENLTRAKTGMCPTTGKYWNWSDQADLVQVTSGTLERMANIQFRHGCGRKRCSQARYAEMHTGFSFAGTTTHARQL